MTEPTGERFQASPELGFAFGRISIKTALDVLRSPELTDDLEADDISLGLVMIRNYFTEGPNKEMRDMYENTARLAQSANQQGSFDGEIIQKYQELTDYTYGKHQQFVAEQVMDINAFLREYPGVIARDAEGRVRLHAVESKVVPFDPRGDRRSQQDVGYAFWGDEEATKVEGGTSESLYVDMAVLPAKYAQVGYTSGIME